MPTDIEIVQAVYEAMATRDIERLVELIAPDCVITQDRDLPWGGRHVGHDGFTAFAISLTGAIESAVTTDAIFEADGEVIQFGHTRGTARATGRTFDIPEVHRWTVRDGQAATAHFAIDTKAMLEALGSSDGNSDGDAPS